MLSSVPRLCREERSSSIFATLLKQRGVLTSFRFCTSNSRNIIPGEVHFTVEIRSWEDCEAGANVLLHCVLESVAEG